MMPRIKGQVKKCDGCGTTECIPGIPYDVTIICGSQLFPAHIDMLQKSSTYFQEYFSSIVAKDDVKTGFVHLKETDGPTFEAVLHFLYSSCICKIKSDFFGKVLEAARFLGIDDLYSYCWEEMNKKLDVDYFAELWTFGEAFEEEESLTKIKCFVASKFAHASRTTDFFNLESRHVETLLRHPQWHGSSDGALVAVVQWTKYNVKKRQQELQNVASCIDLNTVTNLNLGLLLADDVILRAIFHLELKDTILNLCSQRFVQTDQPEPMMGHSIVCFKRIHNSNGMFERTMFHLEEEMWGPAEIIPFVLRIGMAIASYRGCVYGFGGSVHYHTVKTVYQYNPTMNVIYSIANLKTPVYEAAVGTLNNQLYVVGGLRDTVHYKESLTVQRYDPVTRTTTVLPSLIQPCHEPSVVAIGNYLYALGKLFLNLQRYDVALDQWSVIFCPNACDDVCSAVVWDKKLFIVYEENLDAIEVGLFDPIKNEWVRDTIANEPFDVNELWCIHEGTYRTSTLVFHRGSNIKLYSPEVKVWSDVNVQHGLSGPWYPDLTILM